MAEEVNCSLQYSLRCNTQYVVLLPYASWTDCDNNFDESSCGACTFETSTCGWVDLSLGTFLWKRDNGGTSGIATGPSVDHTLGNANGKNIRLCLYLAR